MFFSKESTMLYTKMMAKIPIVIPNKDKKVRNLLVASDTKAKMKLSFNRRI